VAIGEIGLDFHYDLSPREAQREVFRRQIALARELRLPIIVHTREAEAETLGILEEERARDVGGVIHCFSGTLDLARRAVELGFFVSFSGIVAFARAAELRAVARWVPRTAYSSRRMPRISPPAPPWAEKRAGLRRPGCRGGGGRARHERVELGRVTSENFARCFHLGAVAAQV